jgi:protein-S-isoprenylcysteine O-methyltransferase Ste14
VKTKEWHSVVLTLLAIVFTVALAFATVELPRQLGRLIRDNFDLPDFHPVIEPELIEQFMDANHVRPIGYACLAVVVVLMVVGLVAEKRGLASVGAVVLFLPTFGYFAGYMFFLTGLGLMRALWLPMWGGLLKLGDIALLPYMVLVYPFALIGVDVRRVIAYLAIALGLLFFLLGTMTWFYAKFQKKAVADFWLYRFSRHPQYLGWILWSYGLMLLAIQHPVVLGGENPGASLPWLVSSLVIVCVALGEETRMSQERGEEYEAYRARTPFMFPGPRIVSTAVAAPLRVLLKRDRPRNGRELVVTFALYATILVVLSLPFLLLDWPPRGWMDWPSYTLYRRTVSTPSPEHWLSLVECRTMCATEGYRDAVCVPPSEASPDMVGGVPCVIEDSELCGNPGECQCFCSGQVEVPEGVLSVDDMLEERQYNTQVSIYGQVRAFGEPEFPYFLLFSGAEDVEVWYDGMVEENGTQRPGLEVNDIASSDWVVVTGELRSSDGTVPGKGFWASSIQMIE